MGLVGMPGINNSLGQCAVCGDTFVLEIMLNKKIHTFKLDGFKDTLCAHEKCVEAIQAASDTGDWKPLPDGPIRKAYAKVFEKEATPEEEPT